MNRIKPVGGDAPAYVVSEDNWISGIQYSIRCEEPGATGTDVPPVDPADPAALPAVDPALAAEPKTPAEDTIAGGAGADTVAGAVAADPEPKDDSDKDDWKTKRIAKLTARLNEALRTRGAPVQPEPVPGEAQTEEQIQARINEESNRKAAEIAATVEFNKSCNAAAAEGKKLYPDFDKRLKRLTGIVDETDPADVTGYNNFLAAALETGQAAKLIYELGTDLNEAQRIIGLPPLQMAVAVAKLALPREAQVSQAPKPIRPVGGRGAQHEEIQPDDPRSDKLDSATWFARREEQKKKLGGSR